MNPEGAVKPMGGGFDGANQGCTTKKLIPARKLYSYSTRVAGLAGGSATCFATGDDKIDEHTIPFPKQRLRLNRTAPHFALVGSSGSGKTIVQKLWMQAILPISGAGLLYRSLVYDPKRELYPFLIGLGNSRRSDHRDKSL